MYFIAYYKKNIIVGDKMEKKNTKITGLSKEDKELLELIHQSNLTIDDIKWLKNKRTFKKFIPWRTLYIILALLS